MLDGLSFLIALPDFLLSPRYPRALRLTVVLALIIALAAALATTLR